MGAFKQKSESSPITGWKRAIKLLFLFVILLSACKDSKNDPKPVLDTTPPEVTGITPSDGTIEVPIDVSIVVTFSESVDINSFIDGSLILSGGNSSNIAWTATVSGSTVTIKPDSPLLHDTDYQLVLTTGIKDIAGNGLDGSFSSKFKTAPAPDTTAPTISGQTPGSGATNVALNTNITVTFSEAINTSTVTSSTFQVSTSSGAVNGALSVNNNVVTFDPSSDFLGSTDVTVKIGAIEDLSGNAFAGTSWTFTTRSTETLYVSSWTPGNNAVRVGIDSKIVVTFTANVDASSLNSNTFWLYDTKYSKNVSGTISVSGKVVTFTPSAPLTEFTTTYQVNIKKSIKDVNGNTMPSDYSGKFETIILDGNYLYRIIPYYSNSGTQVFDNKYGSNNYYPTFLGTWAGADGQYNSGQKWNIKYYTGGKYFTMTSLTGGESKLLDSGDGTDVAYCSSADANGIPFTGQQWYFTYYGEAYGNRYYFLSTKYQENSKYLNYYCKMQNQQTSYELWSFERLKRK